MKGDSIFRDWSTWLTNVGLMVADVAIRRLEKLALGPTLEEEGIVGSSLSSLPNKETRIAPGMLLLEGVRWKGKLKSLCITPERCLASGVIAPVICHHMLFLHGWCCAGASLLRSSVPSAVVREGRPEGMCGVSQRGEHRSLSPGSIKLGHEVCPIPLVGLDTGFLVPCEVCQHTEGSCPWVLGDLDWLSTLWKSREMFCG